MAYTTILSSQLAHKAPVNVDLMTALAENPVAIANGDPGAPSVLPNIAANVTEGGIGTYVFARHTGSADVSFGGSVAGSTLEPTSAIWAADAGTLDIGMPTGSNLSGTWKCMGRFTDEADLESGGGVTNARGATLWVRTA